MLGLSANLTQTVFVNLCTCTCVFVYVYLHAIHWEHCFWSPCIINFSKIWHMLGLSVIWAKLYLCICISVFGLHTLLVDQFSQKECWSIFFNLLSTAVKKIETRIWEIHVTKMRNPCNKLSPKLGEDTLEVIAPWVVDKNSSCHQKISVYVCPDPTMCPTWCPEWEFSAKRACEVQFDRF